MYSEQTILVLSRTADESEPIARMLADQYRVIEAESADEGLEQLSNGVDVVVAELESAHSHGLELLRKTHGRQLRTPILAVANGGDVNAAVEAMKLGAADCLVKPVGREQLQAAVSKLIERRGRDKAGTDEGLDQQTGLSIDIPPGTSLEDLERAAVEQALAQHQGNRTHAAKTLGISVRTLQRKLKAWGIPIVTNQSQNPSSKNNFILPAHAPHGGHSAYSSHAH
jgi:DNA-binding NtrC family response regulator